MPILRQYPLNKSIFYRLRNKKKLSNLFNISPQELIALSANPTYTTFTKKSPCKKPRLIEHPIGQLEVIHKQIQSLISRIETPSYLFSGKKNTTYIDNAKKHNNGEYFLSMDIDSFYPSTKSEHVFRFFRYKLLMSEDIAWMMTNLTTFNGHIPTGSPISQNLAYWSYSSTFDSLFNLALENNIIFSLYVDDITFSSVAPITKDFETKVIHNIYTSELAVKFSKLKRGNSNVFKVITGVAITPRKDVAIPNKLRKKIVDGIKLHSNIDLMPIDDLRKLLGRVESARRIEPEHYNVLYPKLKSINHKLTKEEYLKKKKSIC